ncbi:MAG: EAL domain-containing protein [Pseudomonadota bacterium]
MSHPEKPSRLRILYLGELSVPARSLIRELVALPEIESVVELTDPDMLAHRVSESAPDLLLVDFGITESAAERYRPQTLMPEISAWPVVAMTSTEREQRGIRAVLHGAQTYLCVERADTMRLRQVLVQCRDQFDFIDTLAGRSEVLATVMEGIQDGAVVINPAGRVVSINPAARAILGMGRDAWPDPDWPARFCTRDAASGRLLPLPDRVLSRVQRGERFSELALSHRSEDGVDRVLSVNGRGLFGRNGALIGGLVSFRDITERFARDRAITRSTLYDERTGIANRRLFADQLEQAVARAQRTQRTLGVLFIDIDRFRSINDAHGHDVGDALLTAVAARLQAVLRQGDLLARWGDDQFVVALENLTGPRDAAAAAQKVVRGVAESFQFDGLNLFVTSSVGIALFPEAGENADALVRAADRAMYQAKRAGGARMQFFSRSQTEHDGDTAELEVGIRHALLRRELTLRYQPRVNLSTGRLMGLEALLRWQHPRFGLLPPARFLSLLESSGLIHSVGEWIIESTAAQLHAWQQRYPVPDLTISINLSPLQLTGGRLVETVQRAIEDHTLDPGCLEFELGDGAASLQRPREVETLKALRKFGVGVTLDHFGTHDISFAALDTTVVTSFVLHQSLIQDVTENEAHQRIVRAAIAMAEGLDVDIAAEGVETQDQLAFLRESRCGGAQGYYISRPMDAEKVNKLLHTESLGGRLLESVTAA